ncbi:MAG: TlpA family protein disulfide reductase, partial [Chromatiales bacterium]|nr:TlpA family protein disulfide reductase [Chromatiales bacterium]
GPPKTMARYGMKGTPTLILVDRRGRLRKQKFGFEEDLVLGAEIMSLIRAGADEAPSREANDESGGCTDGG